MSLFTLRPRKTGGENEKDWVASGASYLLFAVFGPAFLLLIGWIAKLQLG